jgi:uncharacterized repeat protein (TIGR01451 family)
MHRFLATLAALTRALIPALALMLSPSHAGAALRPLQRLSVTLTSDRTSTQSRDVITYTLRVTNTGRKTIGEYSLVMDPPPNLAPVSAACGPVAGQPDLPSPDGLWCEYSHGAELAPGASVTMTLGAQLTAVSGYTPPVVAMVGCATIPSQVGGVPFTLTCAASALD